ncbi:carbon-nitrogen hydrolase family protein [Aureimonas leprariae]|uniref:Carbon-nitrogen hydrolase family protein n=1 Tax=Plantimonas leprariae TaxID=2615207 RepID=A0A7V7PQU0_9HYPH|nr:carbon-nitrogen hydrolase family protein [Aureimonas leprariae]KAB0680785.1 carbon-nitrogen hydrolase family protein [Aureimonas leprariae]
MEVRACQMPAEETDLQARLSAIRYLIADAASDGADVVVFPELAPTGYGAGEAIREVAEEADGPIMSELREMADDHSIAIVIGLALRETENLINAAVVVRPRQKPIVYAKQHLYGEYEKALFTPGTSASQIFEIAGKKAGVLVCFDVEFPERVRELALEGAEIIFVPTALPAGSASRFIAESVVPVRAFENHVFIVYVNHAGKDDRFSYQGLSCVAAPDGARIAVAPEDKLGFIDATIDAEDYSASVETNPYLDELRTALALRRPPPPSHAEHEDAPWMR